MGAKLQMVGTSALGGAARARSPAHAYQNRRAHDRRTARDDDRIAHELVVLIREDGATRCRKIRSGRAYVCHGTVGLSPWSRHGPGPLPTLDHVRRLPPA